MKELINTKKEAEIALRSAKEKVSELEAKRKALESELPLLETEIKKAEKTKDDAFSRFALGEISDVKLEDVRKAYGLTIDKQTKAQELVKGIEKAKETLIKSIPQLQQAVQNAERELWNHILQDITAKITQRELIERAFAVAASHGLCSSYQDFLVRTLPQPSIERVEKLRAELEKEYLQ